MAGYHRARKGSRCYRRATLQGNGAGATFTIPDLITTFNGTMKSADGNGVILFDLATGQMARSDGHLNISGSNCIAPDPRPVTTIQRQHFMILVSKTPFQIQ